MSLGFFQGFSGDFRFFFGGVGGCCTTSGSLPGLSSALACIFPFFLYRHPAQLNSMQREDEAFYTPRTMVPIKWWLWECVEVGINCTNAEIKIIFRLFWMELFMMMDLMQFCKDQRPLLTSSLNQAVSRLFWNPTPPTKIRTSEFGWIKRAQSAPCEHWHRRRFGRSLSLFRRAKDVGKNPLKKVRCLRLKLEGKSPLSKPER